MKERLAMSSWILPAVGYILTVGAVGVTSKLALRTITWQELLLWVPIVYAAIAIVFAVTSGARLPFGTGGGWALLTAFFVALGAVFLFIALSRGEASKVVPVTSAYPVVTLVGSALFLAEAITLLRVIGTVLVVSGVVLISR
jgi:bacterial/archaeal transporter family protein